MEELNNILSEVSGILWGWPMIILLLGTHIYLTISLRFPQRYIFKAIRLSVLRDPAATGDVSQFGSLATALAATIGTGNIIGVATAIALGGPGAVLWCWLTGVFGISTKYAEGLLAIKYRIQGADGRMLGGPMYALERGLGWKWMAVFFALFTALAAFGIGNTVQANAIATVVHESYGISPYFTGIVVCLLAGAVILGGVKSIARVCGMLVPFMACFYILGCIYILIVNAAYLWPAILLIVKSAFSPAAAGGGFVGSTVMMAARCCPDAQPCAPGPGILQRHVLGHGDYLCPHRSGDRQLRHRLPRHRLLQRRHPHQGCFCQDSRHRASSAHVRSAHVCLLHHPRLVLLW